ncbi:MAG: hypothetical protein HYR70_08290 [Chloroflexi bacterium]|nr:hypothetical protein [Chloroflexota bacterium]MBI3339171.1 hypothetical protein [Chloroflexota bacterium]
MKRFALPLILTLTFILAACSAATSSSNPSSGASQTAPQPASVSTTSAPASNDSTARSDQQGAVTVKVTPLNLDSATDTLDFEVVMDTHSVDLSMDLATLATLTTDTGAAIQATKWDAPRGGHHVEGKLIFPAAKDGKSILEGAGKLTLTIVNVDAPSRVFEWQLK